ncbi:MAG: tRNA lysidine(34) synthetase TilS [bacterium JZ-2024 1]
MILPSRILSWLRNSTPYQKGQKILVMLSGGVDSVCLLHILHHLHLPIGAFHFHHQLRADTDQQEEFVRQACASLKIPIFVHTEPIWKMAKAQKKSLEQMGRERRYFWAEEVRKAEGYDWIATAHTASDQVETILMRLLTGGDLESLRGISPCSGNILRPLLPYFREEVVEYAQKNGLNWYEDSSNWDLRFFRNKVRHQLIPFLETLRPGFQKSLLRSHRMWTQDADYLEQKAREYVDRFFSPERIPAPLPFPAPFHRRFLRLYLHKMGWKAHPRKIEALEKLLSAQPGKRVTVSPSLWVVRDRDSLVFTRKEEIPDVELPFPGETEEFLTEILPMGQISEVGRSGNEVYMDREKIKGGLRVRLWKPGDRFIPLGMKTLKKVKKWLTDAKISPACKPRVRVMEDDEKIVWVVGLRLDERVKICENTQTVVHIVWKKPFLFR